MAKQKSILEKFSDTVKGLADSASQALKSEEPARVDETTAAYMPFAAEGLVSDPLLLPPATRRRDASAPRRRRRAARDQVRKEIHAKKSTKKSTRKTARKSASARSKQVAKTTKRRAGARRRPGSEAADSSV